ncbi:MAG: hypothetical protein RMJ43_05295 [Chloroherpetonaceae bacterium]|nr:hypothetical protein [Chthonomonadaceae bacterium]MDW8207230.1 hypothetical protein [Chloroherpetonaceae bacterium]
MTEFQGKAFGVPSLFDPAEGLLVRAPLGAGPGWWAGAPSASYDAISNTFYLVYRMRLPRELGRGYECRIAASHDGVAFTDIWALPRSSLDALSLGRASLMRGLDGLWRLYLGYVAPTDRRWRIGMLEAHEPDQFHLSPIQTILTAQDTGGEGVHNPNVYLIGRMIYLIASYATTEPSLTAAEEAEKHATGDIYSTGLARARTGAAISGDGRHFVWIGDISPQSTPLESGWDAYIRRIGALLPLENAGYLAFYDGAASVEQHSEERTGLAITMDLRTYYSLSPQAPALVSPYSTGSLRYLDVLPVGHELFYYYEMARPDGAHELRVSVTEML